MNVGPAMSPTQEIQICQSERTPGERGTLLHPWEAQLLDEAHTGMANGLGELHNLRVFPSQPWSRL